MGAHSITLHIPDPLYDHIKNQAKRARRSLEAELLRIVATAAPAKEMLGQFAQGRDVTVAAGSRELSIEEAATILNTSRPYLVKLLDDGELPCLGVDDMRRVELGDLIAYKQGDLAHRRRILADLTAEAQDMGLDY